MTDLLFSQPSFGIALSIGAYAVGVWVKKKTGSALANPLLIATILIIALIAWTPITLDHYRLGGAMITMFIVPATVVLAIQIDHQWTALRANLLPVLGGCVIGSLASIGSVWLLCRLFGIDPAFTASLLPKSVTTAISIELSERTGGLPSLTVSAVILTGITSAILSPLIIRLLRLKDRIAAGIAIGASGHAIGTARALELGETEGAFSGIALGLSGVVTSVIYSLALLV
ncbi:MAG: LrgB family protein [Planctomycetaceae bacterium]|nr:LrgB family protein [Planctomycetaceae bacterium]